MQGRVPLCYQLIFHTSYDISLYHDKVKYRKRCEISVGNIMERAPASPVTSLLLVNIFRVFEGLQTHGELHFRSLQLFLIVSLRPHTVASGASPSLRT